MVKVSKIEAGLSVQPIGKPVTIRLPPFDELGRLFGLTCLVSYLYASVAEKVQM